MRILEKLRSDGFLGFSKGVNGDVGKTYSFYWWLTINLVRRVKGLRDFPVHPSPKLAPSPPRKSAIRRVHYATTLCPFHPRFIRVSVPSATNPMTPVIAPITGKPSHRAEKTGKPSARANPSHRNTPVTFSLKHSHSVRLVPACSASISYVRKVSE